MSRPSWSLLHIFNTIFAIPPSLLRLVRVFIMSFILVVASFLLAPPGYSLLNLANVLTKVFLIALHPGPKRGFICELWLRAHEEAK